MAGGRFDPLAGKIRPGTYINFESDRLDIIRLAERGTCLIPLLNANWGPVKEFVTITQGAPNAQFEKLGYNVYDNDSAGNMLLIREALKRAQKVIVYRTTGGNKATVTVAPLTVTAKYPGTRGNNIRFVISDNPLGGKDFALYLDSRLLLEETNITKVEDLPANGWVDFSGTGNLANTAGTSLANGSNETQMNGDITQFLDDSEMIHWNCMAFPIEDPTLQTALKTKITYFRDGSGKYVKAAAPNFKSDYEGIINVTNAVKLRDGTELTVAQATAWVSAVDASARNNQSNTYEKYDDAVDVVGKKSHEEAIDAIKNGEFFFSIVENEVVVEYDINSLTSFNPPKDKGYGKNRVIRVFDTFAESLQKNFPPNKFDNDPTGWDVMEGFGKRILDIFQEARAIKNVDKDIDFMVDREKSVGDETYFVVGLEPVDSAEKLYFTIKTR